MSELEGEWRDGVSSRVRRVRLRRIHAWNLRLVDEEGGEYDWPLAEVRLSPPLGCTPRVIRREGHGEVVCADSLLLAQWFPRAGGGVEGWADWLERRRAAIAVAAVTTALAVVAFFSVGVPWLALHAAERMPGAVEAEVSRQAISLLSRTHFGTTRLPAARQAELRSRFSWLVAGEPRHRQMRPSFVYAPALGPNAFALPDGSLYVTDALVDLAGDEDEILAVLAHEAGHHVHRHGIRQAIESSSVVLLVGLMAGDASGSSLAASIPAVLLGSGFSRSHEREADRYAVDLLRRRGIPPQAFARILGRLSAHGSGAADGGAMGYLSTHPPSRERMRAAIRGLEDERP